MKKNNSRKKKIYQGFPWLQIDSLYIWIPFYFIFIRIWTDPNTRKISEICTLTKHSNKVKIRKQCTWKTLILQSRCISPPWLSVLSSYSALNIQSTEMLSRWMRPNPRKNPQAREPHPKSLNLSVGTEQRLSTELHSIRRTGIPCASQTINTYCMIWKITFFWGISQTRS